MSLSRAIGHVRQARQYVEAELRMERIAQAARKSSNYHHEYIAAAEDRIATLERMLAHLMAAESA